MMPGRWRAVVAAICLASSPAGAQSGPAAAPTVEVRLNAVTGFKATRVVIFSAPSGTRSSPVGEIRDRDRVTLLRCIGGLSEADRAYLSDGEAAAYSPEKWCKVQTNRGVEGWINARFLDLNPQEQSPTTRALTNGGRP